MGSSDHGVEVTKVNGVPLVRVFCPTVGAGKVFAQTWTYTNPVSGNVEAISVKSQLSFKQDRQHNISVTDIGSAPPVSSQSVNKSLPDTAWNLHQVLHARPPL